MSRLSEALRYEFRDPSLLHLALTHPSVSRENNQRLEFLGDAVLEYIISDHLFTAYPQAQEGELTRLRILLVCEETLSLIARRLCVGEALILNQADALEGLREMPSVLCDAMEAIVAAVYLDGGMEPCRRIVLQCWPSPEELHMSIRHPKTRLQEYLQRDGGDAPTYVLLNKQGPDHAAAFEAAVLADGRELGRGSGLSKKQAETAAAEAALAALGIE
jgi:ribonuclease-3